VPRFFVDANQTPEKVPTTLNARSRKKGERDKNQTGDAASSEAVKPRRERTPVRGGGKGALRLTEKGKSKKRRWRRINCKENGRGGSSRLDGGENACVGYRKKGKGGCVSTGRPSAKERGVRRGKGYNKRLYKEDWNSPEERWRGKPDKAAEPSDSVVKNRDRKRKDSAFPQNRRTQYELCEAGHVASGKI